MKLGENAGGDYEVEVAPSRARGLKRQSYDKLRSDFGRALTGAWIETRKSDKPCCHLTGRALTDAWIETESTGVSPIRCPRRALTGAWIETTVQR